MDCHQGLQDMCPESSTFPQCMVASRNDLRDGLVTWTLWVCVTSGSVILQEEAERSAMSAETPAGKPIQPGHQLSFDVTAHAGPAAASPAPEPRQERCQPVPATPEASARMHSHAVAALSPTDALFESWKCIVEPAGPFAAQHSSMWKRVAAPVQQHGSHRRLMSHPICCDSDVE